MNRKYLKMTAWLMVSAILMGGCSGADQQANKNKQDSQAQETEVQTDTQTVQNDSNTDPTQENAVRFEAEQADLTYCQKQADPFTEPKYYMSEEGEQIIKKVFGEGAKGADVIGILGFSVDEINNWTEELISQSDQASGGAYLRQIESPGNAVRFAFDADKAADAKLTFRVASNNLDWMAQKTLDLDKLNEKMAITVNGTMLDLSAVTITGSEGLTETGWQDVSFDAQLTEGVNLVEIYVYSHEEQYARDTFTDKGIEKKVTIEEVCDPLFNLDYLDVSSEAAITPTAESVTAQPGAGIPVLEAVDVTIPENYKIYTCESQYVLRYTATARFSDGSTLDVTDQAIFEGDITTPGEKEFTLTYARNGVSQSGSFTAQVEETAFAAAQVPEEYKDTSIAEKGTVEHMEYTTYVYDEAGNPKEEKSNEAYVYLPYGYSKDQQYDVLYLLHGGGDAAGFWLGQGEYGAGGPKDSTATNFTVTMLDNLIQKGYCDPLIVVTPSLNTSMEDVGANGPTTFRYELKNDLIPAVESAYSTWAGGDVSPENLIATRAHRAYDGLSMGSITSFSSVLMDCTDYIGYVGSFSGCKSDVNAVAQSLNTTYAQYPILYWYNGNGTVDMAHDEHCDAYKQMLTLLPDKLHEGENTIFADKSGQSHSYESWVIDLYNTLGVFFK